MKNHALSFLETMRTESGLNLKVCTCFTSWQHASYSQHGNRMPVLPQARWLQKCLLSSILPKDKITIVKPPIGDPDAKKDEYWLLERTLYGLCHSPRHWYTKINVVLNTIGLHANSSDPCLFTGHIIDPSNPDIPPASSPLTLGL